MPEKNYVQLKINDFVKGNLHIEHMADNAIKQMPPKFQEVGKDIRARSQSGAFADVEVPNIRVLARTHHDVLSCFASVGHLRLSARPIFPPVRC